MPRPTLGVACFLFLNSAQTCPPLVDSSACKQALQKSDGVDVAADALADTRDDRVHHMFHTLAVADSDCELSQPHRAFPGTLQLRDVDMHNVL